MKKLMVSVALATLSLLAWALPTLQQVEAEVQQGRYAQAESMMREVVAAKPAARGRTTSTPRSWRTAASWRSPPRRRRRRERSIPT